MSEGEILRRDGYWPSSPVVGWRGARTRQRIVAETLTLFEAHGYHGTSVDSIAKSAGTSRAALYQYFENKEQIFVELLEECGGALMRVVRRLGPLGPTEEGFDNLRWWLGEWSRVYDNYATMFVQWANVDTSGTRVRSLVLGFVQSYNARVAARLDSSGVDGLDPESAALALTSLVHRFNYFRYSGTVRLPSLDGALDGLAVVMQLMLFPHTPSDVFAGLEQSEHQRLVAMPPVTVEEPKTRPDEGSARAAATVGELVSAGARLFAERGYHATAVDDIAGAAGFARATFYKYFDDKRELLKRLSKECRRAAAELMADLAVIDPGADGGTDLRQWLASFVPFHRRYLGVFRTWIEGSPPDPQLRAAAQTTNVEIRAAVLALLQRIDRPYPLDLDVAAAVFLAVLDRLPEAAMTELGYPMQDGDIVELMAAVVERGLLNGVSGLGCCW